MSRKPQEPEKPDKPGKEPHTHKAAGTGKDAKEGQPPRDAATDQAETGAGPATAAPATPESPPAAVPKRPAPRRYEMMLTLAEVGTPPTAEEFAQILSRHEEFIATGGGGHWETFCTSQDFETGLIIGIYRGQDNPGATGTQADLSQKKLEGLPLHGAQLPFANLIGVLCRKQDLAGTNLAGSLAVDSDFSGTSFRGANLARADFSRSDMTGCDFTGADLSGTDMENCNLTGAILTGAKLDGVRFPGTILDDVLN